jgi:hypothetical protein
MVLSAGLLAGEALIPRTGTLAHHGFTVHGATLRNQTSCKSQTADNPARSRHRRRRAMATI